MFTKDDVIKIEFKSQEKADTKLSTYYYVNTIYAQLHIDSTDTLIEWNANSWQIVDEYTLQFKINTPSYFGYVRVQYNFGSDLYDIHFGGNIGGLWFPLYNVEPLEEVHYDAMISSIATKIKEIKNN